MTSPNERAADRSAGDVQLAEAEYYDQLRDAFLAGFITARTGKYYGTVPTITKRAAGTKFEQYYRHKFQ